MELRIREHQPFTVSKSEAAARQVEGAIEALVRGHFDIAITLAGAAEDMLDRQGSLFDYQRDHPRAKELGLEEGTERKALADHMNVERNWLKHKGPPQSMEFTLYSAAFMIARAVTKLAPEQSSAPMQAFSRWWAEYVETLN
jgi:hypothetical protein